MTIKAKCINIGCGYNKLQSDEHVEWINVDAFDNCKPDVVHDLDSFPYPWEDNSIDRILAFHIMEHLQNWWGAFNECVRILKPGGTIEVRVPHPGSDSALCYRDHLHVISLMSFDGVMGGPTRSVNAWFESQPKVQAKLVGYYLNAWEKHRWMPKWLLDWCAHYLRNVIWEQRFIFEKVSDDEFRHFQETCGPANV